MMTPHPEDIFKLKKELRAEENHLFNIITHLDLYAALYEEGLTKCIALVKVARDNQEEIFVYGSGLNAELAGHANVDWTKFANIKTIEVGIPTLTAFGNDYSKQTELKQYLV